MSEKTTVQGKPPAFTVRMVEARWLIVEVDGKRKAEYDFEEMVEDVPVKAIEIALTALGYVPDLSGMYQDMGLTVLKFSKKEEA